MRLSNEELKRVYATSWNDKRHDIGKVLYGDEPLIVYDEKEYSRYQELTGTLANLECTNAYIYSQNGKYNLYRTLIGEIYIAEDGRVLCGNIHVKYQGIAHDIILNKMYGFKALTILRLSGGKVKGWCTKDGQGSPSNKRNTAELSEEVIYKIFSSKELQDYGESVQKFVSACKELYEEDSANHIMENTFELLG